MIKEAYIDLPEREGVPKTSIFSRMYRDDRQGSRPVVVLLPGDPGNDCSMYDTPEHSIAKLFFEVCDVLLFDPRGCGQSAPSDIEYTTLDHYIDDVEALRCGLNIPADQWTIFGQSYGSFAAIGYAARYPLSLRRMLIIGGVASSDFIEEVKADLAVIGSAEQNRFAEKLWNGSFDGSPSEVVDYYRIMSPLYSYSFVESSDPPLEIPCHIAILNYGWGCFLQDFDFRPLLGNIVCPTLILWGENEWIINRSQVEQVHKGIANSQWIIYSQCSHMLWLDQWARFVEDSILFISQ